MEGFRRAYNMLKPPHAKDARSGFVKVEVRGGRTALTVTVQGFRPGEKEFVVSAVQKNRRGASELGALEIDGRGQGVFKTERDAGQTEGCDALCVWRKKDGKPEIALQGSLLAGGAAHGPVAGVEGALADKPAAQPVQAEQRPAAQVQSAPSEAPPPPKREETGWMWPGTSARVRALYERSERVRAFEQPHIHFVRVPTPVGPAGFDHYLVAAVVDEEDGRTVVSALGYAIPGSYRLTPPPGLEGYLWKASSPERDQCVAEGYWISWQRATDGGAIRECFRET